VLGDATEGGQECPIDGSVQGAASTTRASGESASASASASAGISEGERRGDNMEAGAFQHALHGTA
jgi:hypothetical protein